MPTRTIFLNLLKRETLNITKYSFCIRRHISKSQIAFRRNPARRLEAAHLNGEAT